MQVFELVLIVRVAGWSMGLVEEGGPNRSCVAVEEEGRTT